MNYQQGGRTALAEECYRNALRVNPGCAEALRLRGVIALGAGRYGEATELISAALALNPDDPATLTSLADAYQSQGETYKALPYYRRGVELSPQSGQAHTKLGEAEESIGELEAAADCYRHALALQPDSPAAKCKLAEVLRRRGEFPEALRLCEYALGLDPARSETHTDLGLILTDMKNFGAAAEAFQRAQALNPNYARNALALGYLYFKSGDLAPAEDALRRAIKLDPKMHLAHVSLGSVLSMLGDWTGAAECYERARALCPYSADLIFYLGLLHLTQGNFALGWGEYEQREEARRLRRKFTQPQWKGEPLEGARILLHSEQGLGDTLQTVRYVPMVAARGGQVVLAVQSSLHRLLSRTEGAWQVISEGGTVSDFRWYCPLFSLPLAFGTELGTIPAKIPYVYADPALVEAWRQRLVTALGERRDSGNSLRIGLAWGGDPKHPRNFQRCIPLEQLAPLTSLEGTTFYSLQVGPPAKQLKELGPRVHLIDLQDELKDFADTAAVVANLDLVISVDTSVVHLTGAMGKPVWVLLNNSPDWRWMLEREDSLWYPTARLFRQSTEGNWPELVTRVEGALRELVARTGKVAPQVGARHGVSLRSDEATTEARVPMLPTGGAGTDFTFLRGSLPGTLRRAEKSAPAGGHSTSKPLSVSPHVRKYLIKGVKHHQAGRLESAEACYRRSLKADPRCPQTLHLLGLLARQAGQYQESVRLLGEALALKPDDLEALNSLVESYMCQGQIEPASRCLQRLAELQPQSAEAYHRLGKSQERLGEWVAAMASYERALALQPDSPDLHSGLARLQTKQGAFREAAESCQRALALDPNNHELYLQLGNALTDLGSYGAAVEALRRALTFKPDSAPAVYALGYFFERKGDLASAAESYRHALKLDPRMMNVYIHLGITYFLRGDLEKAIEFCEQAQKLEPESPEARSFLGLLHLQQGNFRAGWSEYEDRWATTYGVRFRRKFLEPLWKGEPLEGSRILLYAEQGAGDTLQFVRYVPLVAARGGKIVLEVQSSLHRLLASTAGATEVFRRNGALPQFDWQCPLLSLPLVFDTDLNTIPAKIPYVHPDPAQVEVWRERLGAAVAGRRDNGSSLRIGLAWAGSPLHPYDFWRSIPLELLAPLTNVEGTTFYSLQVGPPAQQVKELGPRVHLIDLQDALKDFADTAAVVANLDLVISVDTAVVHLAGAMGKPVWVLVQKSADWRWMLEREDSPWYPTAHVFRQATLGNWQDVVSRVERELRLLAKSG
jgi:tetratricopeptide (TPR) repeat protein/ADP-heptose:LPS heptosyltransferase